MIDATSSDGETRRRIMHTLLKHAPVTATEIAEELGMSAAGVRRHLDILRHEELIEAEHRSVPRGTTRKRGRPARSFRLTGKGREMFGHDYDSLTVLALQALRELGGEEAVQALARHRIEEILSEVPRAGVDGRSVRDVAYAMAAAFDRNGYAATVTAAGGGVQLCQHHCPVSHVAEQFPELCAAEQQAIAERTGRHVQPLASIAQGNDVCTTNIPLTTVTTPHERRGS